MPYRMMFKLLVVGLEWLFAMMLLVINWGSLPGWIMSFCGTWYFLAMIKKNVVDVDHNGSWKNYFKSKLKL